MTFDDRDEADPRLSRLPTLIADPVRSDRTRRRCRALLERQRREPPVRSRPGTARWRFGPAVVGVFCVFYVVYVGALVTTTLQLQHLLH